MEKIQNVLIACEESQTICNEMRKHGIVAYSCDLQECSGGHPEWHINSDCLPLLNGNIKFTTQDGQEHEQIGSWDLIIAHPPCQFLTVSGNRWFNVERYGDKALERIENREKAFEFFMKFTDIDCPRVAIENSVGIVSTRWRKPDQIINPWQFGEYAAKKTCLWLKGLPQLQYTKLVSKPIGGWINMMYTDGVESGFATKENGRYLRYNDPKTAKLRSKTFQGIAEAMVDQWVVKYNEEINLTGKVEVLKTSSNQ